MKNVTYLLGAGASFQAMPIVNELSNIAKKWAHRIEELDKIKDYKDAVKSRFQNIADNHELYGTIDTYARSLYLQSDKGVGVELSTCKEYLSLLFLLEQYDSEKQWMLPDVVDRGKKDAPFDTNQLVQIDYRYISLLSKLLERDNCNKWLGSTRFITWNYDVQLEAAICHLLNLKYRTVDKVFSGFSVYPPLNSKELDNPPQIVHLNGVCGLYQKHPNGKPYNFFQILNPRPKLKDCKKEMLMHLFPISGTPDDEKNYDSMINFAWEENEISQKGRKHATKIAEDTKVLIVIGYSFPVFNHSVDFNIIKSLPENSKIVIQDPAVDEEYFCERFAIDSKRVKVIKDVKQFYIPPELFNSL